MEFRNAVPEEAEVLYGLYRSVVGSEFCVWNEAYPSMQDVLDDLASENVYVLVDGKTIVGAISVASENELDEFASVWRCDDGTQKELVRVVITKEYQGRGLAGKLVEEIIAVLKNKGCNGIHLAVAVENIPAFKTYQKAGFYVAAEDVVFFHGRYHMMERLL